MVVKAGMSNYLFTIPEDRIPQKELDHFADKISRVSSADPLSPERVRRSNDDGISPWARVGGLVVAAFIFTLPLILGATNPLIFIGILAAYAVILACINRWANKEEKNPTNPEVDQPPEPHRPAVLDHAAAFYNDVLKWANLPHETASRKINDLSAYRFACRARILYKKSPDEEPWVELKAMLKTGVVGMLDSFERAPTPEEKHKIMEELKDEVALYSHHYLSFFHHHFV